MWIVTQDYIKGQLAYLVENSVTGERRGEFDWQARAQEFADELNREKKRGTWLYTGIEQNAFYCNKCGYLVKDMTYKFCPGCGEYMREATI